MSNIKLNVKVRAYSKGIVPTKISELDNDLDFIADAPSDGKLYARLDKEWKDIKAELLDQEIIVDNNSGIELVHIKGTNKDLLKLKEVVTNIPPDTYKDDTTYYIIENTPDLYINGGTSFSSELKEQTQSMIGGAAATTQFALHILPTNSKGVYNGE